MISVKDVMADVRVKCGDMIVEEAFVLMERMLNMCRFLLRHPLSAQGSVFMVEEFIIDSDDPEFIKLYFIGNGRFVSLKYIAESGEVVQKIYKTGQIISLESSADMDADTELIIGIEFLVGNDTEEIEIFVPWDEKAERFFNLVDVLSREYLNKNRS